MIDSTNVSVHRSSPRRFPTLIRGGLALLLVASVPSTAGASTHFEATRPEVYAGPVKDHFRPTDLTIEVRLKQSITTTQLTRYLVFTNRDGLVKTVAIEFVKTGSRHLLGKPTSDSLWELRSLVNLNNRSYWDEMTLENRGGSASLDIEWLEVWIDYDEHPRGISPMIAAEDDVFLAAGIDTLTLDPVNGRRRHVKDKFGWSEMEYRALPEALRMMMDDIGKSGSSDESDSDSALNPKYMTGDDIDLCSETVSWYYYETGTTLPREDFRDIEVHAVMYRAFRDAKRLYCYNKDSDAWVMKGYDDEWIDGVTYTPQPGDYFERSNSSDYGEASNGHAMMLVQWDPDRDIVDYVDGPWPIGFGVIDVAEESAQYCVGRFFTGPVGDTDAADSVSTEDADAADGSSPSTEDAVAAD